MFHATPQIQHHSNSQFPILHVMCIQPPMSNIQQWIEHMQGNCGSSIFHPFHAYIESLQYVAVPIHRKPYIQMTIGELASFTNYYGTVTWWISLKVALKQRHLSNNYDTFSRPKKKRKTLFIVVVPKKYDLHSLSPFFSTGTRHLGHGFVLLWMNCSLASIHLTLWSPSGSTCRIGGREEEGGREGGRINKESGRERR